MKPFIDLDAIGKKARKAYMSSKCNNCKFGNTCNPSIMDICLTAYEKGFRTGYNQRKKEDKCKKN